MRTSSAALALSLLLAGTAAVACPICVGGAAHSAADELIEAPRAVLAAPEGDRYRVLGLVKGAPPHAALKDVFVRDAAEIGKPLLLVRDDAWPMWVSLGAMDPRQAAALRELAVDRPRAADDPAWQRRVELVLPHLANRQALLAEIAYAECASAPYAALRAARPRLDAAELRRLVSDPQLASRRPVYLLLLGVAGDARDAVAIEAQLDAAWRAKDATNLASLLAADLELRGASRVAWLEDRYLRDRARSAPEITATLLALSVQGQTRGAIPRERVIEAYRMFMREHPDRAGLVAPDLAAWGYWDAAPEYAALLKSGPRQQYASLVAIQAYLQQSPRRASE